MTMVPEPPIAIKPLMPSGQLAPAWVSWFKQVSVALNGGTATTAPGQGPGMSEGTTGA